MAETSPRPSGSSRPTQAVPLQPLERPVTLEPVFARWTAAGRLRAHDGRSTRIPGHLKAAIQIFTGAATLPRFSADAPTAAALASETADTEIAQKFCQTGSSAFTALTEKIGYQYQIAKPAPS